MNAKNLQVMQNNPVLRDNNDREHILDDWLDK